MTRLTRFTDYYEIEALGETYVVAFSVAAQIERVLERGSATDWLDFQDVRGNRHRIPARHVYRVKEAALSSSDLSVS